MALTCYKCLNFFLAIRLLDTIQKWAQEAKWSRGMIPALGAGGPGFKSQFGPLILLLIYNIILSS